MVKKLAALKPIKIDLSILSIFNLSTINALKADEIGKEIGKIK